MDGPSTDAHPVEELGDQAPAVPLGVAWPAGRIPGSAQILLLAVRSGRMGELLAQRALRPHGLDSAQHAVLYALATSDPPTMSLSQLLSLLAQTPSGVTRTVGRLERDGLVRRSTDPDDGRAVLVTLTAKGRRRFRAALADLLRAFEDRVEATGATDLRPLIGPLVATADLFGALAPAAHRPGSGGGVVPVHNSPTAPPAGRERASGDRSLGEVTPGSMVRARRREQGTSQRTLARRVGIGAPHLSRIESGQEQGSEAVLRRIAAELGTDEDELVVAAGIVPGWAADAIARRPAEALALLRQLAGSGGPTDAALERPRRRA